MAIPVLEKQHVKSGGLQIEQEFKILASPHAFKALSDNIYGNKIGSIIRELGTNSYDSHVEAGKRETPFLIHIPTHFEPYYECRDYGVGLSQDQVFNLYSVYFQSGINRIKSNDYVSVYGVGSKSVFSYVKTFNVTSWQDKKQSNYTCYIDEEGFPKVALIGTSGSNEPDGLSVKFSVKSSDIYQFTEQVKQIFKYFKTIPIFTGNKIEVNPVQYSLKTDQYGIRQGENYSEIRAVMGNISYPVDKDQLPLIKNAKIFQTGIDLFFHIGDITPAISREVLSYNKPTIRALTDKIQSVINSIKSEIENSIKTATSLYQARQLVYDRVIKGQLTNVVDHKNLSWNGKLIGDRDVLVSTDNVVISRIYNYEYYGRKHTIKVRENIGMVSIGNELWENDLEKDGRGGLPRLKNYVRNNKKTCLLIKFGDVVVRQKFLGEVGCLESDIKKVSSLPKLTYVRNNGGGIKYALKGKVFKFKGVSSCSNYNHWEEVSNLNILTNKTDSFIYVPIKAYEIDSGFVNSGWRLKNLVNLLNSIKSLSISLPLVYGVRKEAERKLSANWVRLDNYLKSKIPQKMFDKLYSSAYIYEEVSSNNEMFKLLKKILGRRSELDKSSILSLLSLVNFACNHKYSTFHCKQVGEFLGLKAKDKARRVKKIIMDGLQRYPLLSYLSQLYYSQPKTDDIIDYIKLVDNQNNQNIQNKSK